MSKNTIGVLICNIALMLPCMQATEDSEDRWYVDETGSCKHLYVKHWDGRQLFFYISYTGGKYYFGLGKGDDKIVMTSDCFQFTPVAVSMTD